MSNKDIHRRFLHNAGLIVGSRVVFGLLNLGTNVIILRAYGAADLGMVMLLIAYVRVFAEVAKFESWQAVLRFGVIAQERGEENNLRRLIGLALSIDVITMFLAIVAAVLLIPQAADWFGWNAQVTEFAPWFMILIIFLTNATPNGVMRLFERVEILALQHGLNAVIRLVAVLIAMMLGGTVVHLAMAWFAGFVISGAMTMAVCAYELIKRDLRPKFSLNLRKTGALFPGIWHFLVMSNLIGIGPLAVNHLTTLFVGAQLGAAQAAVLQLARQLSTGISGPTRLLGPLLLPDFSRLSGRGDWAGLRTLVVQQIKVAAIFVVVGGGILFAVLPIVVELAFGADLLAHIWLFRLLIMAALINILGFALHHAMFSANKGGTALLIQIAAMTVYTIIMLGGLWVIGLNAVGFGMIGFALTSRGLSVWIGRGLLKKRIKRSKLREDAP
ncbi:Membrane protein involved in the export of O-antigen and teichoic acid [Roseovarius lutimaris]|uniref:Membrane protein involved in the export of O-antigen and teichoic acid n=1 Tax=Roseovarius lutimaris TaxID=1005928 RepID=A0A1I4ZDK8_9RHOB|nr:lipopolysaccharide biosynthesis protein [Roseovarius lutimaris]SFN48288.1 Membrane protein involved in the export of O-antigen and teichoic acid [Roseovarius lutimaris]